MFTGSSAGVFCIKSYHQGAQSKSLEAQKNNEVNKIITLNMDIFYRQKKLLSSGILYSEHCQFLTDVSSQNSLLSSTFFLTLSGSSFQTIRDNLFVHFQMIFYS